MKKIIIAGIAALSLMLLLSSCSTVELDIVFDEPPTQPVIVTEPPTTEPPTTEPPTTEPPTEASTVANVNTGEEY